MASISINDQPGASVFGVHGGGFLFLRLVNTFGTARRVADVLRRSPEFRSLLAAAIATSAIVCLFPFAGGIRSTRMCIAVAALQAALVTVGVVVIFQLNNPFSGPLATSPDPIAAVAALVDAR